MENSSISRGTEVQKLHERVTELERQLTEAQETIQIIRDISGREQIEQERERLLAEVQQQKEEAQKLAEELKAVIDALHDPVIVYDREGVIVRANTSALQAHGFDPSHQHRKETNQSLVIHDPHGRTVDPEKLPSARALKGETVIADRLEITNQQGQSLTILVTSAPLVINSALAGAVSVWHDVTEQEHAERALRESEEKYRTFFDHLYETVSILEAIRDEQGEIIDWLYLDVNQAGSHLLGLSHDQVVGKPVSQVLGVDTLTRYMAVYCRVLETGEPSYHDTSFQDQIFLVSISRMDENRVASIGLNITRRKHAEQALRESELFYRQLLESIPGMVFTTRPDGFCDYQSQQWVDYTGVPMSEHLGDGWNKLLHPEDRSRALAAWHEAVKERAPYNLEYRVQRRDGQYEWFKVIGRPIRDASNQIVRWFGVATNINELKGTEEALRKSEEHFRLLADAMPQLVWTAKPDGSVDYYNQRYKEYYGFSFVEGKSWEWSPVLHPEEVQPTVEAWQRSVETGEIYQIEHRVRMADCSYRWHLSRGVPVRDEDGRILRWFGTATDIHDQKQVEEKLGIYAEQLKDSNRALQEFAYAASHDLQEPLRKIEAFGDSLLESAAQLDDRQRNYLERMRKAAGRLRDMVDGLLQLSRVNTLGQPFVRVDLSNAALEVLSDLEYQIRRTDGKVEVGKLPQVEGDPLQLYQLLQNLIGNALKYHRLEAPPIVKVYSRWLGNRVQILVEDNGIGFEQSEAELMFQPFQRLVGRSQYEGSGMGLAICRRIVERHGGEITARGEPGVGSTFVVTLPVIGGISEGNRMEGGK